MTNYPIVMHSVNTNLAEANQAKVRIKAAKANGQESKNGRRGSHGLTVRHRPERIVSEILPSLCV